MDRNATLAACFNALNHYGDIRGRDKGLAFNHFWQTANQMHAYLRFAEVANKTFPPNPMRNSFYGLMFDPKDEFFESFYKDVNEVLGQGSSTGFWSDDFGWVGMACISVAKAYKKFNFTSPHSRTWQNWRDFAFSSLDRMIEASKNPSSVGGSPVPNGLSNSPLKDPDGSDYLKNTVTNAMFFLLPLTLYEFCKDIGDPSPPIALAELLNIGHNQYSWFAAWFETKPNAPKDTWDEFIPFNFYRTFPVKNGPKTDIYAIIEDRPAAFPPQYTYQPDGIVGWSPDGVWSGDQGIFLAACALYYQYAPDLFPNKNDPTLARILSDLGTWFTQVARGAHVLLCNDGVGGNDGVIREAPFDFLHSSSYIIDYLCGRGVFARFLNLDSTTKMFQEVFPQDEWNKFHASLESTAAVISKTASTNQPNPVDNRQLSASWASQNDLQANDHFFDVFGKVEGKPPPPFQTVYAFGNPYDEYSAEGTGWNNYCMIMGMDVYAAYLSTNPFPLEDNEEAINDGEYKREQKAS